MTSFPNEPEEPVAWQYRFNVAGKWGRWHQLEGPLERFRNQYSFNLSNGTAELRPLYAYPHPQPLPLKEEVERVLEPFAKLANDVDLWRHEDNSTCMHRIAASALRDARALLSRMRAEISKGHVTIAHDGFSGDIIGHYQTREGKRGVVVQQDGTRVVHVYGEKWINGE